MNVYKYNAIELITQEKRRFHSRTTKFPILESYQEFFLSYMLITTFNTLLPARLLGTTRLLSFAKFAFLHVYLALHVYLEH